MASVVFSTVPIFRVTFAFGSEFPVITLSPTVTLFIVGIAVFSITTIFKLFVFVLISFTDIETGILLFVKFNKVPLIGLVEIISPKSAKLYSLVLLFSSVNFTAKLDKSNLSPSV